MSMLTLAISCLTSSNLPWFIDLKFQLPIQYCSLLASDFTFITSSIHNWVLFLLWLRLFILSGVSSPLTSSSILGTYQPGEFIFQCSIFLPFHSVHGVLKARILTWFSIPFSSGQHFVRTLHHDPKEPEIKLPTSVGSSKKQESSRKASISALTMSKPLTVWITTNWEILKEMGLPNHLTCLLRNLCAGQKATELDMEQQTGSKSGKEYVKDVYCHLAYLASMQSASCEILGWMKHNL